MTKIILGALLAGFGAQLIKLTIYLIKRRNLGWHDLIVTGGMPSSHAAFVVSLATLIYLSEGSSTSFALSLVLAIIVLRDAFGVRRTVGEEGLVLEKVINKLRIKTKMHYAMGHTPLQVIVGSLFGLTVALGVHFFL